MDSTLGRSLHPSSSADQKYEKLHRMAPPPDKHCYVYLVMVLSGVGFLLPYNSFVTAADFFQDKFPGSTIIFDISLIYILSGLIAVLLNNIIIETFSLYTRIMFGYLLSLVILLIFLFIIFLNILDSDQTYALVLLLVAVLSLGATIQQSSFYGLTGLLPPRYTQAVMTGESVAGCLACLNRLISRLVIDKSETSTSIFIGLSIIMVIICSLNFHKVQSCELIRFYLEISNKEKKTEKASRYDAAALVSENKTLGKLETETCGKTETQILIEDAEYYQLPEFGSSCRVDNRGARVEDAMVEVTGKGKRIGGDVRKCMAGIKYGVLRRLSICRTIWPHMLAMALTYLVTLSLYPGVETLLTSCSLGAWTSLVLMSVFNVTDLLGKMTASVSSIQALSSVILVLVPLARIILVPLTLLAATRPSSDWLAVTLTAGLGLSNGLFGSLPIIIAPQKVSKRKGGTELTGNLMTGSYCLGLTLGAGAAYFCDWVLETYLPYHSISSDELCPGLSQTWSAVDNLTTAHFIGNNYSETV